MYNWKLIRSFREGYRLFRCENVRDKQGNLRYAIADHSGKTPELCNDGVLWLDRKRDIQIGRDSFLVPVRNDNNNPFVVGMNAGDALMIANMLELPVKIIYLGRYQIMLRELKK